jgi:hypothetical protein
MEKQLQQIQYVMWGSKRGVSLFFSSPDIDTNRRDIANTLKDVRSVVRFTKAKIDFYSMEFTDEYKVLTQYRSIYDWAGSDGGFLAATIFIPHGWKLPAGGVLALLNALIEQYWQLYVDDFAGSIKNNVREDVELFNTKVAETAKNLVRDTTIHFGTSPQNDRFAFIRYSSNDPDRQLTGYFDSPYRYEFKNFQEIVLVNDKYELPYMKAENTLSISAKVKYLIKISGAGTMFAATINGKSVGEENPGYDLNDTIEVDLNKPDHNHKRFNGAVRELMNPPENARLEGSIITWTPVLIPNAKDIRFVVKDRMTGEKITDAEITVDNIKKEINRPVKFIMGAKSLKVKATGYQEKIVDLTISTDSPEEYPILLDPVMVEFVIHITSGNKPAANVKIENKRLSPTDGKGNTSFKMPQNWVNKLIDTPIIVEYNNKEITHRITQAEIDSREIIIDLPPEKIKLPVPTPIKPIEKRPGDAGTEKISVVVVNEESKRLCKAFVKLGEKKQETDENGRTVFEINNWKELTKIKVMHGDLSDERELQDREKVNKEIIFVLKNKTHQSPEENGSSNSIYRFVNRFFKNKKLLFLLGTLLTVSACGIVFGDDIKDIIKNILGERKYSIVVKNEADEVLKRGKDFICKSDSNLNIISRNDTIIIDGKFKKLIINNPDSNKVWFQDTTVKLTDTVHIVVLKWNVEKRAYLDSICKVLEGVDFTLENLNEFDKFFKENASFAKKVLGNDSAKKFTDRINALQSFFTAAFSIDKTPTDNATNDKEVYKGRTYLSEVQQKGIDYFENKGKFSLANIRKDIKGPQDKTEKFGKYFTEQKTSAQNNVALGRHSSNTL